MEEFFTNLFSHSGDVIFVAFMAFATPIVFAIVTIMDCRSYNKAQEERKYTADYLRK